MIRDDNNNKNLLTELENLLRFQSLLAVLSAQFGDLMKKFNYDVPAKPREYGARIQREVKTYFETAAQVGVTPQ